MNRKTVWSSSVLLLVAAIALFSVPVTATAGSEKLVIAQAEKTESAPATAPDAEKPAVAPSDKPETVKPAEAEKPAAAPAEKPEAAKPVEAAKPAAAPSAEVKKDAAKPADAAPAIGTKLEQAIAKTKKGSGKGEIDVNAPKGFMDIPGAPTPNILYGLLWGTLVGLIFSSVGAFGGIMAGVGHMSVFGLGDYAGTFKKTGEQLSRILTDSIRCSNQYLVGLSGLISSITYYRMGRLVLPLALFLGVGAVAGAYLIPLLTAGKVDLKAYQGYFGITVLIIGGFLFYETTPRGQAGKKEAKKAAEAFEREHMRGGAASAVDQGVKVVRWGLDRVEFTFYGAQFGFNPILPVIGGFVISAISSFIGVGGGFLYVPFLTSLVGLPMYIVAGTSALAVLISMITSISGYMYQGTPIDFTFVGVEMVGIFIGSLLGPIVSKKIPDIWLKRFFVVLALYVGMGYVLKAFVGGAWRLPGI